MGDILIFLVAVALVGLVLIGTTFRVRRVWLRWVGISIGFLLMFAAVTSLILLPKFERMMWHAVAKAGLVSVAQALDDYQTDFQTLPPTLECLVEAELIPARYLDYPLENRNTSIECDYAYVVGLHKDDPQTWPIMFCSNPVPRDHIRLVVRLSGAVEQISAKQFDALYMDFRTAYHADRGEWPVIVWPVGIDPNADE